MPSKLSKKISFSGLTLEIEEGVYPPAEDTYFLISQLENIERLTELRSCIEVGVGSGAILCKIVSEFPFISVIGTEIDPCSAKCSRKNLFRYKENQPADVLISDLLTCIRPTNRFDLLLSNPPYLPDPKTSEEPADIALHGGYTGAEIGLRLLASIPIYLSKKGVGVIIFSSTNQIRHLVRKTAKQVGMKVDIKDTITLRGNERLDAVHCSHI